MAARERDGLISQTPWTIVARILAHKTRRREIVAHSPTLKEFMDAGEEESK